MRTFEIYFQDLTPDKQQELFEFLGGENGNYDVIPLATLQEYDEDDD